LHELENGRKNHYVPAMYFAGIYIGTGNSSQAMNQLNQAFKERSEELIFLGIDPILDPLRSDQGFKDLLRHIGLTATPVSSSNVTVPQQMRNHRNEC